MSDNRVEVERVEMRDAYTFDGKPARFIDAGGYRIGYEPDTDKLVVNVKGSKRLHVIPWTNVTGMQLASQVETPVSRGADSSPKDRDTADHDSAPSASAVTEAPASLEATHASRSAPRGGGRRARPET